MKLSADDGGKVCLFQHQRCFVKNRKCQVFNDTVRFYIAEAGNFMENAFIRNGFIRTEYNNVRRNTKSLQFLYRVLGGFGFVFTGCLQIRNQGHMNIKGVFTAHFMSYLTDSFDKGLAFYITDGSADFRNDNIRIRFFTYIINETLDFIGNVRNGLYRAA